MIPCLDLMAGQLSWRVQAITLVIFLCVGQWMESWNLLTLVINGVEVLMYTNKICPAPYIPL